jgi:hypothetical protein
MSAGSGLAFELSVTDKGSLFSKIDRLINKL